MHPKDDTQSSRKCVFNCLHRTCRLWCLRVYKKHFHPCGSMRADHGELLLCWLTLQHLYRYLEAQRTRIDYAARKLVNRHLKGEA